MSQQDSIDRGPGGLVTEHIFAPFHDGHLEGWLAYDQDATACDGVLLLSPHPQFAGTMDNNVIRELATSLSLAGNIVLRFNYPGIGMSSLRLPEDVPVLDHWNRVEEEQRFDEAIRPTFAALAFLEQSLAKFLTGIHLVGYSYGAMIALLAAEKTPSIRSVTAISLPWVSRYRYGFLSRVSCRKLFVVGRHDFAFEPAVFEKAWPEVADPKTLKEFDCDHFFRRREKDLGKEIIAFLGGFPTP